MCQTKESNKRAPGLVVIYISLKRMRTPVREAFSYGIRTGYGIL